MTEAATTAPTPEQLLEQAGYKTGTLSERVTALLADKKRLSDHSTRDFFDYQRASKLLAWEIQTPYPPLKDSEFAMLVKKWSEAWGGSSYRPFLQHPAELAAKERGESTLYVIRCFSTVYAGPDADRMPQDEKQRLTDFIKGFITALRSTP